MDELRRVAGKGGVSARLAAFLGCVVVLTNMTRGSRLPPGQLPRA